MHHDYTDVESTQTLHTEFHLTKCVQTQYQIEPLLMHHHQQLLYNDNDDNNNDKFVQNVIKNIYAVYIEDDYQ